MNTETTVQRVHQLVDEYNNHQLSTADYRLRRRQLLVHIDANVNGVAPQSETPTDLITLRKSN